MTPAEGESTTGCMCNLDLLMMGLWGLKHVEERGNPDIVYRRKRIVYHVGNKYKINTASVLQSASLKFLASSVLGWCSQTLNVLSIWQFPYYHETVKCTGCST
jgi:hypothetical protein